MVWGELLEDWCKLDAPLFWSFLCWMKLQCIDSLELHTKLIPGPCTAFVHWLKVYPTLLSRRQWALVSIAVHWCMVSVPACDFPVLSSLSVTTGSCLVRKQGHRAVLVGIWCGLTFFWYLNYNDPQPKIKFAFSGSMPNNSNMRPPTPLFTVLSNKLSVGCNKWIYEKSTPKEV